MNDVENSGSSTRPFQTGAEWEAHVRWRGVVNTKHTPFDLVREVVGAPIDKLEDFVFRGGGVSLADHAVVRAFRIMNEATRRTQSWERVRKRYEARGIAVDSFEAIRGLPLEAISDALPSYGSTYDLAASIGGGINGALGAPGAVLGVPTLLGTSLHAIGAYATHFGYDLATQYEQDFAVLLLTTGLVTRPSQRGVVVRRLEEVAFGLEQDPVSDVLEEHGVAILENVAEAMVLRLLLGLLVRSWPGIGLVLGAGFSRAFVGQVCTAALAAYGQRWLFRHHGAAARLATSD